MEQNEKLSLDEVLARFREEAQGNKAALGTRFEWLVRRILTRLPLYRDHFRRVWLWSDLEQGHDTGIDLVAEDCEGNLCGIQAKCYEDGHVVAKPDIDTFLAKLGGYVQIDGQPRAFANGIVFATTDAWGKHADETLAGRPIPVQVMTLSRLRALDADWAALAGYVEAPAVAPKALRDYQVEALAAAAAHYATHDRGKLIMACGTGKTFTALRLWEQESGGKGLALFLVPSIALLNQSLLAWADDATFPFHAVCVCSDANAHRRASDDASSNALVLPPTTSAKEIARRIRYYREQYPNDPIVVFSTYQSIEMVEQAQRELGREAFAFDFAICDEAHRTTGAIAKEEKEPAFVRIHDNANLLARKRLYMTATPRLYGKQGRFEAIVNQLRFDHGSINATDPTGTETAATGIPSILISNGMSEDDYASLSVHEPGPDGEMVQDTLSLAFPENMARFRDLLYARVVEKCGNRKYFERWAADVGQIAAHHVARLKELCETDPKARDAFQRFHALLQSAACATITEDDARVMLAQQRLTGPIFDALFGNNAFTAHNPISEALDHATALLAALETDEERKKLGHFYQDVRDRVSGIRSADGKLEIIRTLYDTFFASAFAATAKKLGIVFTPIEVVDFILRSADDALKKYFGKSLSDEGVHILDPFTGTGTFIARLLQKDMDLIRDKDLERKYLHELHANEIVLLSYYIAAVNIENVFHDRAGRKSNYAPFPGIVLGDTFRIREFSAQPTFDEPGSKKTPNASAPKTMPPSPSSSETRRTPSAKNPPTTTPRTKSIRG